jgi:hypothetical protein
VLPVAAVAIVLTATTLFAQSPSLPFLSTLKINPAKSDMTATRLQFVRKPSGEITMTLQGMTYDFRIDGKSYPAPYSSMAIWTETGSRSWRTLYRMNNVDNDIDNYTLSPDWRMLTLKTDFLVPTPSQQTMTFARVGTGEGLH